jgi:hypothetical protein
LEGRIASIELVKLLERAISSELRTELRKFPGFLVETTQNPWAGLNPIRV